MKQLVGGSKDDVLEKLMEEHRRLDERLRILDDQCSLTSAERIEYCQLKKMKLLTKDRIERLRITA